MKYGPTPEPLQPEDIYISVCSMCGYPLKPQEISARLVGCLIDITDPLDFAPACLDFCVGCTDKVLQFSNEEISVAISRMQEMKGANHDG